MGRRKKNRSNGPARLRIYTDGGCDPNPGKGGWGAVLRHPDRKKPVELSGGEGATTNNRMEITAALEALRTLPDGTELELYTDSMYLKQGITEWIESWKRRSWITKANTPVVNRDLWEALDVQVRRHTVHWNWVKGHAGDRWNERADALASREVRRAPRGPAETEVTDDATVVQMFTAASFVDTNDRGGWAVEMRYRDAAKSMAGVADETSANRMHLVATIAGLQALTRPTAVRVHTCSKYVVDGATTWMDGWQARGWLTHKKKDVAHRDLWEGLRDAMAPHEVRWSVVPNTDLPEPMASAKVAASAKARGE